MRPGRGSSGLTWLRSCGWAREVSRHQQRSAARISRGRGRQLQQAQRQQQKQPTISALSPFGDGRPEQVAMRPVRPNGQSDAKIGRQAAALVVRQTPAVNALRAVNTSSAFLQEAVSTSFGDRFERRTNHPSLCANHGAAPPHASVAAAHTSAACVGVWGWAWVGGWCWLCGGWVWGCVCVYMDV